MNIYPRSVVALAFLFLSHATLAAESESGTRAFSDPDLIIKPRRNWKSFLLDQSVNDPTLWNPIFADGRNIYLTSKNGSVFQFDAQSGLQRWRHVQPLANQQSRVESSAFSYGGQVAVIHPTTNGSNSQTNGGITILDEKTGRNLKTIQNNSTFTHLVQSNTLAIASYSSPSKIGVFDLSNQWHQMWETELPTDTQVQAIRLENNVIYVLLTKTTSNPTSEIVAINKLDGAMMWTSDSMEGKRFNIIIGTRFIVSSFDASHRDSPAIIEKNSGHIMGELPPESQTSWGPSIILDRDSVIGFGHKTLSKYTLTSTDTPNWQIPYQITGPKNAALESIQTDKLSYFATESGLTAFDKLNGEMVWHMGQTLTKPFDQLSMTNGSIITFDGTELASYASP
jgi:outer membrane protein assembly factor BamB